jgi:hypothetical protein
MIPGFAGASRNKHEVRPILHGAVQKKTFISRIAGRLKCERTATTSADSTALVAGRLELDDTASDVARFSATHRSRPN